ncbi:MAG: hypothetical protein AAF680_06335 [Pseudomonadota bacterium]
MSQKNIEDFYYNAAETLCLLYAMFPIRSIVLVEDICGPIKWDLTGLPDRKSQACFEAMIWLSEHELLSYRSIEDRNVGLEGAVLTQKAFVLLTSPMTWEGAEPVCRIDALNEARRTLAYANVYTIMSDLFRANCLWNSPATQFPLIQSETIAMEVEESD